MAIVTFDSVAFKAAFPAFSNVDSFVLKFAFDQAGLYLNNSDCSVVQDIDKRRTLLWLLTAHIAYLTGALSQNGSLPPPVGRVSSATEGSVSIGTEYGVPGTAIWFSQSAWGAMFWQATAYLRSFRYAPRQTRVEGLHVNPYRR